jgi:hypothetical protein
MGIPITNYSILKALADGLDKEKLGYRNSFEMDFAIEALQEYSVYAFIIHDPEVHTDFHSFLDSHFDILHYQTGDHLAFFGLVDSPQKFCLEGNRPFYSDIRNAFDSASKRTINREDLSYSAFTIANALKIDYDSLPVLVVTHDLRLESFKWFKTCKDKLELQMSRLTAISNKIGIIKERDSSFVREVQKHLFEVLDKYELNLCNGQGDTRLYDSMARALSNIMSILIEAEDNIDFHTRNRFAPETRKQNHITLDRLTSSIKLLKIELDSYLDELNEPEQHPNFSVIENLSIQLATYVAKLNKKHKLENLIIPIQEKWLEPKSYHLLTTGLDVGNYLGRRHQGQDFSASAICLTKMFEKELNSSIIHLVRREHSIDLPLFFNEYQPNRVAIVKTGEKHQVDVNNHKFGKWLPPELGKTKNLINYYFTPEHWKKIGIENKNSFFFEWKMIHEIRNRAAHTEDVGLNDFTRLKNSLFSLADQHIFEKLYLFKKQFKPVGNIKN